MTHMNRTDLDAAGPPPPDWGPGRNAALSLLAFVVIFGMFAYVKGDARDDQPAKLSPLPAAAQTTAGTSNTYAFVTPAESKAEHMMTAQPSMPVTPVVVPSSVEIGPQNLAAAPAPAAPVPEVAQPTAPVMAAVPHIANHVVARPIHKLNAAPAMVAYNTHHAAPSRHDFNHQAYVDALRQLADRGPTHSKTFAPLASKLHPYGTYTRYTEYKQASVTHEDQSGAQALSTARACAVMDQWQCVEENASRSLAIDPENTESQTLLQQAIRNRI